LASDNSTMQNFIPRSIEKLITHLDNDAETDVEKYFTDLYLAHSNGHFSNLMEICIVMKLERPFLLLGVQSLKARFAKTESVSMPALYVKTVSPFLDGIQPLLSCSKLLSLYQSCL
jgi:hypothetical protein